jgi:hypothetical protein
MNDKWIVCRSALRRKHALHGTSIERMRSQSVHRLGWKRDETTGAQAFSGTGDRRCIRVRGIHWEHLGHD